MSIAARFVPTDEFYRSNLCSSLKRIHAPMDNDPAMWESGMRHLWNVLTDMEHEIPYRPPWNTSESRPYQRPGAEFQYRRPVWDAVAAEIDKVNSLGGLIPVTKEAKVAWLREQLKLCYTLKAYGAAIEHLRMALADIPLTLHVGDGAPPATDVVVTGSFKIKAETAKKAVYDFAGALLATLEKTTEKE